MKATDDVGITFANLMLGRGILNGVVNITLGAFEFNPSDDNKTVEPTPVITCRLRLDVPAAIALRDALIELTDQVAAVAAAAGNGVVAPETEQAPADESKH